MWHALSWPGHNQDWIGTCFILYGLIYAIQKNIYMTTYMYVQKQRGYISLIKFLIYHRGWSQNATTNGMRWYFEAEEKSLTWMLAQVWSQGGKGKRVYHQ